MTVTLGAGAIGAVYLGATPVEKMYVGTDLVWSATPAGLPTGMSAWWDVADLSGLADGDPVDTWTDKSGNGFDLTKWQAAPTWDASNQQVAFDGTQFLTNVGYSGGMADDAPYTVVCSSVCTAPGARDGIVSTSANGANGAVLSWDGASTKVYAKHGGVSGAARTAMTPGLMWMRWDGADITIGGGTTAASLTTPIGSIVTSDRITLGAARWNAAFPLHGRIGSVVTYPWALDNTDLAAAIAAL